MKGLEMPGSRAWRYDAGEIWADGVIHVTGLVLAAVGTVILLMVVSPQDGAGLAAHVVYCVTLLVTLSVSAAYNLWPVSAWKWRLRRVDHAMIFGLIAGTYTPFLIRSGQSDTNLLLIGIWSISLVGIGLKLADVAQREWVSTVLYLALGWSGLLAVRTLVGVLPMTSFWLIVAGGLLYSLGSIFHHWRALRFQNAIWHGFVLAAASCHFAAVLAAVRSGASG